ncbi:MAG: hypothetical protein HN390_13340 [Anaerolineae bacterium]|jgi:hypothetical protein|nr:hypothetical protein [Anaerolineae bacterium]MBT7191185.1 hypothetical protein [Anaerolineae bacterium]MBT7988412.1 hypothetical protein [Anaerolineae bacterium]
MKRSISILILTTLAFLLIGCGASPASEPAPVSPADPAAELSSADAPAVDAEPAEIAEIPALAMDYEGALTQRLLLSLGTLELANTDALINAEQASQMIFLWQALNNMTQSGNSAEEEVAALLNQIEGLLTPEQITAINAMQLTQEDIQAWGEANRTNTGTGEGAGQGQGSGSGMSPEARATRQAEGGKTGDSSGENGLSAVMTKALIEYLQSIQ